MMMMYVANFSTSEPVFPSLPPKKWPNCPKNHSNVSLWCTSKLPPEGPTNASLCLSNFVIANNRSAAKPKLDWGRFQGCFSVKVIKIKLSAITQNRAKMETPFGCGKGLQSLLNRCSTRGWITRKGYKKGWASLVSHCKVGRCVLLC